MRAKTRVLHGEAELWDPEDPEPFRRLAGDRFLRVEGDTAVVRDGSGAEIRAAPGWIAVRTDGDAGPVRFASPGFGAPGHLWGPE